MAIYEYGGKVYELADGTPNDVALAKIKASVGGASAAPAAPAAPMESQIPTNAGANLVTSTPPERSFVDQYIRAPIEAGAAMVTGVPAGLIGQGAGIVASMFGGKYGTQAGVRQAEDISGRVSQALTRAPRGEAGQELATTVGEGLSGLAAVPIPMMDAVTRGAAATLRTPGAVVAPARDAMAARSARAAQAASVIDESNAVRINTVKAAQALPYPISFNPAQSNPTIGNRVSSSLTGASTLDAAIVKNNTKKWGNNAQADMGLDVSATLSKEVYDALREKAAAPYREVKKIDRLTPNEAVSSSIRGVEIPDLVNSPGAGPLVQGLVDRTLNKINSGMTGDEALTQIESLRGDARVINNAKNSGSIVTPADSANARASLAIANALEDLIDSNVPLDKPALLADLRQARVQIAKSYAYQSATNLDTGLLDPSKLPDNMTGVGATMRKIAANFPDSAKVSPNESTITAKLTRSGPGGTLGAVVGAVLPIPNGILLGGAVGAGLGNVAGRINSARIVSPSYQARNAIPLDRRIPYVEPPVPAPAAPQLLGSSGFTPETPFRDVRPDAPNFTFGSNAEAPPRATPTLFPQLPAPSGEGTRQMVLNEQNRQNVQAGDFSRARDAAQQAAESGPSALYGQRRGTPFQAPTEAPVGRSIMPSSAESAAEKILNGQLNRLDAAEKVAWQYTKLDLEKVSFVPGYKELSPKEVLKKMESREWVANALKKAKEEEQGFAIIARNAVTRESLREAQDKQGRMTEAVAYLESVQQKSRASMLSTVDTLEDALKARPTSRGKQGPVTRKFQEDNPTNRLSIGFGFTDEEMRQRR
jgi:hypothetical protein